MLPVVRQQARDRALQVTTEDAFIPAFHLLALRQLLTLALVLSPFVTANVISSEYVVTHQIRVEIQIVIHSSF